MSLVERCYVSISNKLRRQCTRTSDPARVKTTLVETLCGFRHASTWGLLRPVAGATLHALSSTSDGDLPRNRVQSHFMADIQAKNLMTSECSLSRRPIQLNYSIVQTSVIVYNDTQIYLNLNILIDDSSQAGVLNVASSFTSRWPPFRLITSICLVKPAGLSLGGRTPQTPRWE